MPDRPNLLVVTTDSQGWNALGAVGDGFVDTPNVDSLAADGVRFDRTYATAPVCGPSRTGLYTGRYPHDVGAWTNGTGIEAGVETAGDYLRRAGYRTALVGKWHLDGRYFGTGEAARGYEDDYWYDGRNYRADVGEAFWEWYRSGMDGRVAENDIDEIHDRGVTREDTWAGNVTDRALAFVRDARDGDRPFFLAVNYDEPHEPATCPPPYCDRYRGRRYPLPDNYETVAELAAGKPERQRAFAEAYADGDSFMDSLSDAREAGGIHRPLHFGCGEFVDAEMGRLFDAVGENTLVVFTADHGHYLGAHGLDLKHFAPYDEVVNVPMIASGPGLPVGAASDALIGHVDLLSTLLEAAGAAVPDGLHGRSFYASARDPDRAHRETVLVEHNGYGQGRADGDGFYPVRCLVSSAGRKLVVNLLESDELYDLDADPGELDNLIDDPDRAAVRDRLHDRLLAEMDRTDDAFHGRAWADRAWRDAVDPTHPG